MTRSPSLSVAIQRLREQLKVEATVLLDAACELGRSLPTLSDVADAFIPEKVERQRETRCSELERAAARHETNRLYKAAMSQASLPAKDHDERARLAWLALESFRRADAMMLEAGCRYPLYVPEMQPDAATKRLCSLRAMAIQRLEWRGGRRPDEEDDVERTNPYDVLEAMVAQWWSYDDLPTEREALSMVGGSRPRRRNRRAVDG